jgi:Ca2+-dependent lipid-binding protein
MQRAFKGPLRINVLRAEGLRKTSMFGKQDPYVKLSLNKVVEATRVAKGGGSDPRWGQQCVFVLQGLADEKVVSFTVFDKSTLGDDVIGVAALSVQELVRMAASGSERVALLTHGRKAAGKLYLSVSFDPTLLPDAYHLVSKHRTPVARNGGTAPQFNQQVTFDGLSSEIGVHCTVFCKRVMGAGKQSGASLSSALPCVG